MYCNGKYYVTISIEKKIWIIVLLMLMDVLHVNGVEVRDLIRDKILARKKAIHRIENERHTNNRFVDGKERKNIPVDILSDFGKLDAEIKVHLEKVTKAKRRSRMKFVDRLGYNYIKNGGFEYKDENWEIYPYSLLDYFSNCAFYGKYAFSLGPRSSEVTLIQQVRNLKIDKDYFLSFWLSNNYADNYDNILKTQGKVGAVLVMWNDLLIYNSSLGLLSYKKFRFDITNLQDTNKLTLSITIPVNLYLCLDDVRVEEVIKTTNRTIKYLYFEY